VDVLLIVDILFNCKMKDLIFTVAIMTSPYSECYAILKIKSMTFKVLSHFSEDINTLLISILSLYRI
jgi:hypothetical protein